MALSRLCYAVQPPPTPAAPVPLAEPITSFMLGELAAKFTEIGQPGFRARQLLDWVYRKRARSFAAMSDLPAALRTILAERFTLGSIETVRRLGSDDTTQKYLFRLPDSQLIETVLIPASPALYGEASDRRTLCISTQVGCAYGCKFCASGLDGWKRNLRAGEIIEQILRVEESCGEKVNNLVFMGMGEPLANYEQLLRAIGIINAPWGIGLGARHITVSTSGLAPQIRQLADQPLQIRLAISLHGATDPVRTQIMPVNRKYPLAILLDACRYYHARKKQKLTFEYILIDRVNDTEEQAVALAGIAADLDAKVNLIPYNTVEGLTWTRPPLARQQAFQGVLRSRGVQSTLRREKGHDIAAACGQLRRQTMTAPVA